MLNILLFMLLFNNNPAVEKKLTVLIHLELL